MKSGPLRVLLLLTLGLVGLAALVHGCGPLAGGMINGGTGPGRPQRPLALVIRNMDVAYPESLSVTWWEDSTVVGTATQVVPPGGTASFSLWCPGSYHPTGFSVMGSAWPTGNTWGYPDYEGTDVFVVDFPTGGSRKQP